MGSSCSHCSGILGEAYVGLNVETSECTLWCAGCVHREAVEVEMLPGEKYWVLGLTTRQRESISRMIAGRLKS